MLFSFEKNKTIVQREFKTKREIENFFFLRVKKYLTVGFLNLGGRNFMGRITVYTKGNSIKKFLRILDRKRILCSKGLIISVEYDKFRSSFLGCICYVIGLFSYVVLVEGMDIGST
jgi:ribosomal protein L2